MSTDNFRAWQLALQQRDQALYALILLAAILVGSYLLTYATWLPPVWGRRIRLAYEVGGVLLYTGIVIVCIKG